MFEKIKEKFAAAKDKLNKEGEKKQEEDNNNNKKKGREVFSGDDRYSKRARKFMAKYGEKDGMHLVFSGYSNESWDVEGKVRIMQMKELVPGFIHVDGYIVSVDSVKFEGPMIVWHTRLTNQKIVAFAALHERELKDFDKKRIEKFF